MANAEQTELPGQSFDLVTIMYAFHEAPKEGRDRILQEAYRVLQPGGTLAVVDISTDYTPSDTMLAGEPYVLEYQKNIHRQLKSMRGFSKVKYQDIVPNHVGMWILKRSSLEL
jgi:ubiquinone/menaquinone biosynthesis C-methylase UbiE